MQSMLGQYAPAVALLLALFLAPVVKALVRARLVLAPRARARRREATLPRATVCSTSTIRHLACSHTRRCASPATAPGHDRASRRQQLCKPLMWLTVMLCVLTSRACACAGISLAQVAFVHPDLGIGGAERLVSTHAVPCLLCLGIF